MAAFAIILFCIVAAAMSAVVLRAFRALSSAKAVAERYTTAKRTPVSVEKEKSFPYYA